MLRDEDQPNLPEIAAFVAVVERGGFGAAAATLGVTKSSVSRRVVALERKLGARLLQRTSRQMMLTEVGRAYHGRVAAAMGSLRDASALVGDLQGTPRGHLRITAPVDVGRLVARMMLAFGEQYPEVTSELVLTQRAVDLVGEGFDVALRAGTLRDSSLVGRSVGDSVPILMASPTYLERHGTPTTLAQLAEHRFVLFRAGALRPGVGRLELEAPGESHALEVRGHTSADDFGFVRDLVVEGGGIALLPTLSAFDEIARGALVRVLAPWRGPPGPIWVVYPSRELVPAKTRVR
jgi:DNA-binding transcriptional LysR family regulator